MKLKITCGCGHKIQRDTGGYAEPPTVVLCGRCQRRHRVHYGAGVVGCLPVGGSGQSKRLVGRARERAGWGDDCYLGEDDEE